MLKGKTKIQLFNGETGELEYEREEHNAITNCLYDIYNRPRIVGFANQKNHIYECPNPLSRFCNSVVCLAEELDEDGDNYISNAVKTLMESISGEEPEIIDNYILRPYYNIIASASTVTTPSGIVGTLNSEESGVIPNGYRYVWDWPTNAGNGKFRTICLTDRLYNGVKQLTGDISNTSFNISSPCPSGYKCLGLLEGKTFIFGKINTSDYSKIDIIKRTYTFKVGLTNTSIYTETEETVILPFNTAPFSLFTDGMHAFCYNTTAAGAETILELCSINLGTLDIDLHRTIFVPFVVSLSNGYSPYTLFVESGYVCWMTKIGNKNQFIIFDIDDVSTIKSKELATNITSLYHPGIFQINGNIYFQEADNYGNLNHVYVLVEGGDFLEIPHSPCKLYGTYPDFSIPGFNPIYVINTSGVIKTSVPHLATINSLAQDVTKFNTQTMKITYEITQGV